MFTYKSQNVSKAFKILFRERNFKYLFKVVMRNKEFFLFLLEIIEALSNFYTLRQI